MDKQSYNPEALMAEEANAQVVLLSTSPDGQWHEVWSKQYNRSYYVNVSTNETTWIRPSAFDSPTPMTATTTATTTATPVATSSMPIYVNTNPVYITASQTRPPIQQFISTKADDGCGCVCRFLAGVMFLIAGSMLASIWGTGGFLIGQQNCSCIYRGSRTKCSYECGPLLTGVGMWYASYIEYSPLPEIQAKSFVRWTDFNTANACQFNTSIFKDYTLPNGFCVDKGNTGVNGSAVYEFQLPTSIIALPGLLISACILSWVGCIFGVTTAIFQKPRSRILPLLVSFAAMSCCVASFALFTQVPLFTSYQTVGNHIPWRALNGELRASNYTMTLPLTQYYGVTVASFIFITLGTMFFACARYPTKKEKNMAQDQIDKMLKQNDIILQ